MRRIFDGRRMCGAVLVTLVWYLAGTLSSFAEEPLAQRDGQGPVTVAVTLMLPAEGTVLKVAVALETHSLALDAIRFEQAVSLRTKDGDVAPTALERPEGSGHHRSAVAVFATPPATGEIVIVVKDVGGIRERVFTWPSAAR